MGGIESNLSILQIGKLRPGEGGKPKQVRMEGGSWTPDFSVWAGGILLIIITSIKRMGKRTPVKVTRGVGARVWTGSS